jgi:hypothetical protein
MSSYRKFDVASPGQAIQASRDLDLLTELELWPFRPVGMMWVRR